RIILAGIAAGLIITACNSNASQGPPPIPHKVTEELCVTCHREGKNGAPKMNHPARGTCTTCHEPTR
ncbi:MAG: hypothetical protein M1358_25580, partial [Chloroflexi bacterium]|nr:hypothetical protein [Chloroflexota bacterium]